MALVPGSAANSTHAYACAVYCPNEGEFVPSARVGDGRHGWLDRPKDRGSVTVTQEGVPQAKPTTCEHWEWTQTLFGFIIPMEHFDMYVDMSGDSPKPFFQSTLLEPFHSPIGTENTSWLQFTPGSQSEYIDVDPDSIKTCKMSSKCQKQSSSSKVMQALQFQPSLLEVAEAAAAKLEQVRKPSPPPPPPTLHYGDQFITQESNLMLINQGGHVEGNGDVCCDATTLGQCQVQLTHRAGTRYFDKTNQRSRFDDTVANEIVVDDFTAHKSMLVNTTNGVDMCQEYCPIDPRDTMQPYGLFSPFDTVKDLGSTTMMGKPVRHFEWSDKILKFIKMSTTDFYVDNTTHATAVPVYLTQKLTPFGMSQIGGQNITWTSWNATAPPKEKFDIKNMDSCPVSKQCQQQKFQAHFLSSGYHHTFANFQNYVQ